MCGIFGVVGSSTSWVPDERRLQESARLLAHRGPDHHGWYAGAGVGLSHTRLSLLDLSVRSNQPLWDTTRRYCLVYNGEIYNHQALRMELEGDGAVFQSTGDTEVLLRCLLGWGPERTMARVEGMFAFALYDRAAGSILVGRDRFGIKPVFYSYDGAQLLFGSEVRALRPWTSLRPDPYSLSAFLQGFGGPTSGHTLYDGIRFLPPGAILRATVGGRPECSLVLGPDDLHDDELAATVAGWSADRVADELEQRLFESVQSQLVADARVGALCSGGVDSSLILALASRTHADLAVFHANVVGRHSELQAARLLARHLGLELLTVDVHDEDILALIPDVVEHAGHPFTNTPHSVPFLQVSRLVAGQGVKAVLSGEGADECFHGYDWQLAPPWSVRQAVAARIRRTFGPSQPYGPHYSTLTPAMQRLVVDLHNRFEIPPVLTDPAAPSPRTPREAVLDALGYNLRALLHRNDAMGMAASVESRFPFLDTEVVRFGVNLPVDMKLKVGRPWRPGGRFVNKWVLRKVADRYLPPELSRRPKAAFTVDAFRRMRIAASFFHDGLLATHYGIGDRQVDYLLDSAEPSLAVKFMQLEVWLHVCVQGNDKDDIARRLRAHVEIEPSTPPSSPSPPSDARV